MGLYIFFVIALSKTMWWAISQNILPFAYQPALCLCRPVSDLFRPVYSVYGGLYYVSFELYQSYFDFIGCISQYQTINLVQNLPNHNSLAECSDDIILEFSHILILEYILVLHNTYISLFSIALKGHLKFYVFWHIGHTHIWILEITSQAHQ